MLIGILLGVMFLSLFLEIPMLIGMLLAAMVALFLFFPALDPVIVMQQMVTGLSVYVLLAIPMFILAAEIMCAGECAKRLLRLCRAFVGHLPGGLAVTSSAACTIFGAISGSTQATFVAIGRPMFKELVTAGYKEHHAVALLMNSANIALLIPPSVVMIMYSLVSGGSVAKIFVAGVVPGLFMFLVFALYEILLVKFNVNKRIVKKRNVSWQEKIDAFKEALLPLGFPVIVLGGIYSGIFSPTEAAAVSVVYAFILEYFIYKSITLRHVKQFMVSTGMVTGTVFVLVAGGQVFSWVLTFAGIPQQIASLVASAQFGPHMLLIIIALSFFVACMFVDCIPVVLILTPIFFPITTAAGIDPIHLGILITLQSAVGCISPPFGCNIFTAVAIFDLKFTTVIAGLIPYLLLLLVITCILIVFPQVSLFLPNLLF